MGIQELNLVLAACKANFCPIAVLSLRPQEERFYCLFVLFFRNSRVENSKDWLAIKQLTEGGKECVFKYRIKTTKLEQQAKRN